MNDNENFNLELVKNWDESLNEHLLMKKECIKDNDFQGVAMYNAIIDGFKQAVRIYEKNLEHQFYYTQLLQCELDDLIIKYPII